MTTYCLVRPEHLNHHGYLFGGQLLKWVDEYAWLAATREHPGEALVTRAMDRVEFKSRVPAGSSLRFDIILTAQGNSSLRYSVCVYAMQTDSSVERIVFSTCITFVAVDKAGNKKYAFRNKS